MISSLTDRLYDPEVSEDMDERFRYESDFDRRLFEEFIQKTGIYNFIYFLYLLNITLVTFLSLC